MAIGDFFSSIASGFLSLFGLPIKEAYNAKSDYRQYQYQLALNKNQQFFNEQQADKAYDRQRQLLQDSPELTKLGMKKAGISTAGLDSGGTAPVVASASSSAGAAPSSSASKQSFSNSIDSIMSHFMAMPTTLSDIGLKRSQERVENANADAIEAKIPFIQSESIANINKLEKEGNLSKEQADYYRSMTDYNYKSMDARVESVIIDNIKKATETDFIKIQSNTENLRQESIKIANDLSEEQLKKIQYENTRLEDYWNARIREINSETSKNLSDVRHNAFDNAYKSALTYGQRVQNALEEIKVPMTEEYKKLYQEQIKAAEETLYKQLGMLEEELKKKKFDNEHLMAEFVQQQITGYLNSFGTILGSILGSYYGAKKGASSGNSAKLPNGNDIPYPSQPYN